jgi:glycerophosphoryl diester phosphodiesterase
MSPASGDRPIVIAHRGASGYLPEHTVAAKVLAHAQGADYLEQDVVLSRDNVPIVFHDLTLEEITDVAERYPGRARADGHWYVLDLTLPELKTLTVRERDRASGAPQYPGRFQERAVPFAIVTLEEELALIRGLNTVTGRRAGIYTEVKSPAWHRAQARDLSPIVLDTLARFGYRRREDPAYLQCFDAHELKRIRGELGSQLKLVQLIGENDWAESDTDYDHLQTAPGLASVAGYADAIGPWIPQVARWPSGNPAQVSGLTAAAHERGLAVHPYTFRSDDLPAGAPDAAAVHRALFETAGVDGLFSDFPDQTRAYLESQRP